MKKAKLIFIVVLLGILAFICYLFLQNNKKEPDMSAFGTNTFDTFEYTMKTEDKNMVLDCHFPNPTIESKANKSIIRVTGLENSMGGYQLPTRNFVLALPKDSNVTSITLDAGDMKSITNIELEEAKLGKVNSDASKENDTNWSKELSFSVQEKEGCKFVIFSVTPCEYNPSNNMVKFYLNIKVNIALEDNSWNIDSVSKDTIEYLKEKVDNPDMIDTYSEGE